jgi:hypothetical protein
MHPVDPSAMLEEHNYFYSMIQGEGLLVNFETVYIPQVPGSSWAIKAAGDEKDEV